MFLGPKPISGIRALIGFNCIDALHVQKNSIFDVLEAGLAESIAELAESKVTRRVNSSDEDNLGISCCFCIGIVTLSC